MAAVVSPRSLDWIPGDQELLRHYDDMTSEGLLIGPESAHYHTNVLRLAQKYTYLRNTLLSTAALHLSRSTTRNAHHATQHLHHLTSALHNFQEAISLPLLRSASDALIITSFLITIQYFSLPDSSSLRPESSWIYSASPTRLSWLSVQQGTSALLGKFRPHHCENRMLLHFSPPKPSPRPSPNSSTRTLPDSFFTLCNVTDPMGQPGCHQNPYHDPVHALYRLLPLPTGRRSLSKYLHFVSRMYAPFIQLVERNDHRALLILGYWFALICGVGEEVWWCWGRARRDCWAICEVLNREAGEEVRDLVGFMEGACGFEREEGEENRVVRSRDYARSENEFQGVDCD
ncbi:unnamed protein product [Zymoseptoria tritici ST99CH_3D7]|uniref:C6 transcription factor n=2 Tax=Zymoseptoria tritici TaxID=1047171 RepID=A0A1X7S6V6_ZYMT9|nr:unnamed protein product [Zymoseptoria tritici ST99CH_3D7]